VDELPKGERDAVSARDWKDCSTNEIAAKLGISNEAARQRLSRARRTLS
jgi:DNA-directed RNA polymerase specialized sigma24 family protein